MFEVVGRYKRVRPTWQATVISVVVHALFITLLVLGFRQTLAIAGEGDEGAGDPGRRGGGGGGGGGGGEQVSYYDVPPPPPPPPVVAQPEPDALVPPVVPPPPPPPAVVPPAPPAAQAPAPGTSTGAGPGQGQATGPGTGPGSGGGSGGGTGGGTGTGTGTGTGPGTGTGAGGGSRIIMPRTDLMLIPPPKPRGMSSRELTLSLTVNERGDVTDVQLLTPTGNRGYDEALKRMARDWKFDPGRDAATNRPVAVTDYRVIVTL